MNNPNVTEKPEAIVEHAYREGYQDGYQQGVDDSSRYERGGGNPHAMTQKHREDEAWETSLTKTEKAHYGHT